MTWVLFLSFLKSLWDKFAFYIVAAGSLLLALLIAFGKGRSAGKRVYREKHEKLNQRAAEKTSKIVRKIEDQGNDEIQRRLRRYYRD